MYIPKISYIAYMKYILDDDIDEQTISLSNDNETVSAVGLMTKLSFSPEKHDAHDCSIRKSQSFAGFYIC